MSAKNRQVLKEFHSFLKKPFHRAKNLWRGFCIPLVFLVLFCSQARAGGIKGTGAILLAYAPQQCAADGGVGIAARPIAVPEKSRLTSDFRQDEREWFRHHWEAGFLRRSGNEPWFKDAAVFVGDMFDRWGRDEPPEKEVAFAARGKKLIAEGANDPLVLWLAASAIQNSTGLQGEFAPYVEQAFERSRAEGVEASLAARILIYRALNVSEFQRGSESDTAESILLLGDAVEHGEYTEADGEILLCHLFVLPTIRSWPDLFLRLAAHPKLDEVSRLTIQGCVEDAKAWNARGGGWASTVTEEGWRGFKQHSEAARDAFSKAWKLNPKRPQAPSAMIAVAMGLQEGRASERLWFDRAIEARFDYMPAYDNLLWALRPRWGGSHEEMLSFGRACMATSRYDTDVPLVFFKATMDIAEELEDPRAFFRSPEVACDTMQLSQKLLEEPSRKGERTIREEGLATNAWLTGDCAMAARLLEGLHWKMGSFMDYKLGVAGSNRDEMMLEVATRSNSTFGTFQKAQEAMELGEIQLAYKLYTETMPELPEQLKPLLTSQIRIVELEQALATKNWVALPVTSNLEGWMQKSGFWTVTEDGKLQTIGNGETALVVHRVRLGKHYEMTARFSVEPREGTNACCGLAVGYAPAKGREKDTWLSCETYRRTGIAQHAALHFKWWSFDEESVEHRTPVHLLPENEIYVCRDGDRITFQLNGNIIAQDVPIPLYKRKEIAPGILAGIVANNLQPGYVAKAWDVRVRKW